METKVPQAFPTLSSTNTVDENGRERHAQQHYSVPGMTLRDYFAAKFMAARLANPVGRPDITDDDMAKAAYQRADALLRAREAK